MQMCILIFIGTNGETYFNTAALVTCVQNFPKSRGPVVGILKGFAGLGGAILTQIYAVMHSPEHASLIFMVAVGPTMVVIALMFIVKPVGGHKQIRSSDGFSFSVIYCVCLVLASYLMGVMLVEDILDPSYTVIVIFTVILFFILLIPIAIPITLSLCGEPRTSLEEALLPDPDKQGPSRSEDDDTHDIIFSEVEDEKPKDVDKLPASERQKRIAQLQAKLAQAAAEGAVRIKKRRPHRGEDFTLMEALIKADFWLIFFSLLLGSGSGLTVIDNLGQMSQSLGYDDTHVFVSMISIWNFLGRIGGGYFSENIVRYEFVKDLWFRLHHVDLQFFLTMIYLTMEQGLCISKTHCLGCCPSNYGNWTFFLCHGMAWGNVCGNSSCGARLWSTLGDCACCCLRAIRVEKVWSFIQFPHSGKPCRFFGFLGSHCQHNI